MLPLDFDKKPLQAFEHGLLKGLAAPYALFGRFQAPRQAAIASVTLPHNSGAQALLEDWQTVGADIRSALEKYEQAHPTAKK